MAGEEKNEGMRLAAAEDALRESEERYRAITESAAYGILTMDEQSVIRSANPAAERILGYKADELIGQSMTMIMPERFRAAHRAGVFRFLQTGQKNIPWAGVELPASHKNGNEIPLEISFGASIRNGKHFFTGIFRDITERKEAEKARLAAEEEIKRLNHDLETKVRARTAALRESNEQLESFIYTVAHDLRAPLRAMEGRANILSEDYTDKLDADGQTHLKMIVQAAQRMDTLIEDLLDYSRMSRSELAFETVNLSTVVENTKRLLAQEIEARHARLEVELKLTAVFAHQVTLEHVMTNLISNSLKFVDEGIDPHIRIWTTSKGKRVQIWVGDNGIGISREYHEKIFGIFERLYPITKYPGTGVGLAIVRKGVERMGGTVGVESEPGKGSRFWVDLPRA